METQERGETGSFGRFLETSLGKVATALGAMCKPTWDSAFQVAADVHGIGLEAGKFDRDDLKDLAIATATAARLWVSGGSEDSREFLAALKRLGDKLVGELHLLADAVSRLPMQDQGITPRLVVVDDSRVSATALANAFSGGGFSVRAVSRMDEAVELFFSFAPHVLVSDVFMPDVDVVELCRRFRMASVNQKTFIVLISASQETELAARLEMIKPDAFVPKAAGAAAVLAKVTELCRPAPAK